MGQPRRGPTLPHDTLALPARAHTDGLGLPFQPVPPAPRATAKRHGFLLNMFLISKGRWGQRGASTLASASQAPDAAAGVGQPRMETQSLVPGPAGWACPSHRQWPGLPWRLCSPSRQAEGCSFLLMEPGRLVVPEPGAEWARAEGCGVWQADSHSRCSWLDHDPSSVLRDPGPSSTERTLSANLRE